MAPEELETLAAASQVLPGEREEADGRRRRGNRTRESIVQEAADLASVEGLEGLTIGRLATELGISKSGLFAHFGSKEELQLATVDAARRRFVDHVVRPSRGLPRGRRRVQALMEAWLDYYRSEVFRGGCFFHTVKTEFDARGTSAVREVVAADAREFLAFLTREVRKAQEAVDVRVLAPRDVPLAGREARRAEVLEELLHGEVDRQLDRGDGRPAAARAHGGPPMVISTTVRTSSTSANARATFCVDGARGARDAR